MPNEIKRRVFLYTGIGVLAGMPFIMRSFHNQRKPVFENGFEKTLALYRRRTIASIETVKNQDAFEWKIAPRLQEELNYISFIQGASSRSQFGENELPDMLCVAEGKIHPERTRDGATLLVGWDTKNVELFPQSFLERSPREFCLLVRENKFVQVEKKNEPPIRTQERNFVHLLSLVEFFPQVKPGLTRVGERGRFNPCVPSKTNYLVNGFDRVNGRDCVRIHFERDATDRKNKTAPDNMVLEENEKGNAWFDIQTGLLTRQMAEISMKINQDVMGGKIPMEEIFSSYCIQIEPTV